MSLAPNPMRDLTPEEHDLLRHTLGLSRAKESYRNYFCAGPDHDELPVITTLIEPGAMKASHTINGGRDTIFKATEAGQQACLKPVRKK
jgi:hypothetical protein